VLPGETCWLSTGHPSEVPWNMRALSGIQGSLLNRLISWRLSRRALRIVDPDLSYQGALSVTGLNTLRARRERISQDFFLKIFSPEHRLHHLISEPREVRYGLRRASRFPVPVCPTGRAQRTLVNYGLVNWQ